MTDKPREWPNNAREARDRAAEELNAGIRLFEPLITGEKTISESERQRIENRAFVAMTKALRWLESVGACTRP